LSVPFGTVFAKRWAGTLVRTINFPFVKQASSAQPKMRATANALGAFEAEDARRPPPERPARSLKPLLLVAVTALLGMSGLWAYNAVGVEPPQATLTIQTTPPGAHVTINGQDVGQTPVVMNVAPGTHGVQLRAPSGEERRFEVTLRAGESVVHQFEWATPAPAVAPTSGALQIQTEPPGQTVFVDDVRRGISPITVTDLAPGSHAVHVTSSAGTFRRQITITAGETLSLVIAPNTPALSAGWLKVSSPVLLQLHVAGNLVGDTKSDRVMLPSGEHDVVISNESLGYSVSRRVAVVAGRTSELHVAAPNGRLNINAQPWAEVWLNGERVGTTPIANLSWPIGTHNVVLRHPQLGERGATLTVSLKETARLGIDMRQR
jgi:hypothetical protein